MSVLLQAHSVQKIAEKKLKRTRKKNSNNYRLPRGNQLKKSRSSFYIHVKLCASIFYNYVPICDVYRYALIVN